MINITGKKQPKDQVQIIEVGQVYEATSLIKRRKNIHYQIVTSVPKSRKTQCIYVIDVSANGEYMGVSHWAHDTKRKLVGQSDFRLGDCAINIKLFD